MYAVCQGQVNREMKSADEDDVKLHFYKFDKYQKLTPQQRRKLKKLREEEGKKKGKMQVRR